MQVLWSRNGSASCCGAQAHPGDNYTDLKLENVLLRKEMYIILLDFNLLLECAISRISSNPQFQIRA